MGAGEAERRHLACHLCLVNALRCCILPFARLRREQLKNRGAKLKRRARRHKHTRARRNRFGFHPQRIRAGAVLDPPAVCLTQEPRMLA
jgi:hypothetical protein